MAKRETGEMAIGDLDGEKLYQKRARITLPLLVRQARAGQPIYYSDLAEELEMPNPRNLNDVLGAVGNALLDLGEDWGTEVPPLQALVFNRATDMPGDGLGWFAPDAAKFKAASTGQRREIVKAMLMKVYSFDRWDAILAHFSIRAAESPAKRLPARARPRYGAGRGESAAHRALKEWVSSKPTAVGLPKSWKGTVERSLRSGDSVDVYFETPRHRVGVEVKTAQAPVDEVARGLFQCVKYLAVLEAEAAAEQRNARCRCILGVEGIFPAELRGLKNTLGIEVRDGISVGS